MPTPAQFYAPAHTGNRFGVSGSMYGPHGHLGQDFNGWPAGTPIPSWVSGNVVSTGWSGNLGWFVTVLAVIDNGAEQVLRYVSFCHMASKGHALGPIWFGDTVGPIGATGELAAGVHVHIPVARSGVLGGYDVEDPLPFIRHAIGTTTAGNGSDPLEDDMPLNDDDLGKIRSMVAELVQREARSRLYFDTDKKVYVAIAWDLPSGDPGKVAYSTNLAQLAQLKSAYEEIGDTADQAVKLPHAGIVTLIGLARGTDGVYTPPAGFLN